MASRIAGDGRVTVSERRSTIMRGSLAWHRCRGWVAPATQSRAFGPGTIVALRGDMMRVLVVVLITVAGCGGGGVGSGGGGGGGGGGSGGGGGGDNSSVECRQASSAFHSIVDFKQ